jgi:membrane fusion protein (multidrug efflux system)
MPAPPNKRVLVIAGLIALIALGIGGRMWYRSHYFVETENAYVSGHLHPVSSRLSGVVTRVLIEDNQAVQQGDLIAELDPTDQLAKVAQISAQIAAAGQQVLQADAQIPARQSGCRALRPVVQQSDEGRLEGRTGCR